MTTTLDASSPSTTPASAKLTDGHLQASNLVLYPRAHFVIVPAPHDPDQAPADPSFGTGAFCWPQIDLPNTPDEKSAAWNRAVYSQVLRLAGEDQTPAPTALDPTVDGDGKKEIFYRLRAANRRLIVVDLGVETYGYGAAHPLTSSFAFSWWLTEKRELTLPTPSTQKPPGKPA